MDTLEPQKETKPKSGFFVQADDLEKGQLLAVHSIKDTTENNQIMGQAFKVAEICLPFMTVNLVSSPWHVVTLDARYLNFMRVTEDYAKSQAPHKKGPQP